MCHGDNGASGRASRSRKRWLPANSSSAKPLALCHATLHHARFSDTIGLAGETEAGNAGERPARDSRPG